jgi:nicotinate-nucleotide pyrophosphorylase (carboxylating)
MLEKGMEIAVIAGNPVSLLKAERVALNFLQRLCGISSQTKNFCDQIKHTNCKLLDTRKTTPLFRRLEKYAVQIGGGFNHRFGLYDMVLIKENHIRAVGSITNAVTQIRSRVQTYKIEVEVTNFKELEEAYQNKADRIMLDNMSLTDMKKAVKKYGDKVELEASGNVSLKTIKAIAETGVHFISCGALTHSYRSLDISLLFEE